MADFDKLLCEAKLRGMGILMDLVANHSSDQHAWFKAALQSPDAPERDYYVFRPGRTDAAGKKLPPNNWMSFFGGPAWTWSEEAELWYLTLFTPWQCDFNWKNPALRQEIWKLMRFWLDKGVAGFRMDVINTIAKAEGLPDKGNPAKSAFPFELVLNREETHEYIHEMRAEVLDHYDCVTLGEGPLCSIEDVRKYTAPERDELDMMFQFDLHNLGYGPLGKYDFRRLYRWKLKDFAEVLYRWQCGLQEGGAWIANYLSNHDQNRQVSRFGNDKRFRSESAKALCVLNFCLRGPVCVYQGEEIAMADSRPLQKDWKDYEAKNAYRVLQSMMKLPGFLARRIVRKVSRDNARTPMQWGAGNNAQFSTGEPWMPLNSDWPEWNVQAQEADGASVLHFYRRMAAFRAAHPVLATGSFHPLRKVKPPLMAWIRENKDERLLVLVNFSSRRQSLPAWLPDYCAEPALVDAFLTQPELESSRADTHSLWRLLLATEPLSVTAKGTHLKAWEARIYMDGKTGTLQ